MPSKALFKILFLSWVLYGLHISTAFQGKLISILTTPIYEAQIKTDIELFKSDVIVETFQGLINRYPEYMSQVKQENLQIIQGISNTAEDHATCLNLASVMGISKNYTDEHGNSKMYIINSPFVRTFISIWIRKGHPILVLFNRWILRMHAYGFTNKFWNDAIADLAIRPQKPEDNIILTLQHLEIAFRILIIGWILSTVFFIIEINQKV